jgi:hypothetical protein
MFGTCAGVRAAVQDTYDDTGRRVRKARVKASQAIAEHAQWVTHNPYRMPAPDGAGGSRLGEGAVDAGKGGEVGPRSPAGLVSAAEGAAPVASAATGAFGRSGVTGEEDDDAQTFTDGAPLPLGALLVHCLRALLLGSVLVRSAAPACGAWVVAHCVCCRHAVAGCLRAVCAVLWGHALWHAVSVCPRSVRLVCAADDMEEEDGGNNLD